MQYAEALLKTRSLLKCNWIGIFYTTSIKFTRNSFKYSDPAPFKPALQTLNSKIKPQVAEKLIYKMLKSLTAIKNTSDYKHLEDDRNNHNFPQ